MDIQNLINSKIIDILQGHKEWDSNVLSRF